MKPEMKADYCITLNFERGSESPSRVFRSMTELIDAFASLDKQLVGTIDTRIEPVILLEDIEVGSLKVWLKNVMEGLPDEALARADWKMIVGHYLVRAKRVLLDWCDKRVTVTTREEVVDLQKRLQNLAEETQVNRIPAYGTIDAKELLLRTRAISGALSHLRGEDRVSFGDSEGEVPFNMQFQVSPESLEEILTDRIITHEAGMILKVKRPDYLGEARWDLRHGKRAIEARILDEDWLKRFQARMVDVRPGDSLDAHVRIEVRYGADGEMVAERHEILKVRDVVRPPFQLGLDAGDETSDS